MLLFFEGMMCKQRQNSLLMLRNMRRPPVPLLVFRYGQWTVLESDLIGALLTLSSLSHRCLFCLSVCLSVSARGCDLPDDDPSLSPPQRPVLRWQRRGRKWRRGTHCALRRAAAQGLLCGNADHLSQLNHIVPYPNVDCQLSHHYQVNEAMLTGESVPQMKEPPGGDKVGTCGQLDIGSDSNISPDWKRHLVGLS